MALPEVKALEARVAELEARVAALERPTPVPSRPLTHPDELKPRRWQRSEKETA